MWSMSFLSLPNLTLLPLLNAKLLNRGYNFTFSKANLKIKAEFAFHNIKMYPYDNDELDEEERALNTQIKVSPRPIPASSNNRIKSPLRSWDPRKH
jgi:hypothetical protein